MFELIKIGNQMVNDAAEFRPKAKTILNGYYSVQFYLNGKGPSYLFRLRNKISNKPYILVKKDSSVFNELKVGDILDMEYNHSESLGGGKIFKTLITSKFPHDSYTGHSKIELSIIDNREEHD
jgi:hypothetical protein